MKCYYYYSKSAGSLRWRRGEVWRHRPHGAQGHPVGQVSVVRQQGGEEVLGEGVHGDALPVDDLAHAAERTRCDQRGEHTRY